jgi:hypothetical protein
VLRVQRLSAEYTTQCCWLSEFTISKSKSKNTPGYRATLCHRIMLQQAPSPLTELASHHGTCTSQALCVAAVLRVLHMFATASRAHERGEKIHQQAHNGHVTMPGCQLCCPSNSVAGKWRMLLHL